MDIKSTSISGITSIRDSDDAVNKQYVDGRGVGSIVGNEGEFLTVISNQENIVTSGLVLNLDAGNSSSYSGSGTTWTDLSGNNKNATLVNGPTYNSANGGSIIFDGNNDYSYISSPSPLSGTQLFTFEIWVNFTSISGNFGGLNKAAWLFAGGTGSGSGQPELGVLSANNSSFTPDTLVFGRGSGGTTGSCQINVSSLMTNGSWYQIVLVRSASNAQLVYLNGTLIGTGNVSNSFSDGQTNFGSIENNPNYSGYLNGKVANVKIYNRALTAAEIQQNFNSLAYRFTSQNTIFGETTSWEPLSSYSEYTNPGLYIFNPPSYAKEFLIEATGAGGGGASGNTEGDTYSLGSVWTARTATGLNYSFYTILYGDNLYLLGEGLFISIFASTDGLSWSARTAQFTRYRGSAYAADKTQKYVFVGQGGTNIGSIVSSTDSIVWILRTSGISGSNTNFDTVTYGDGLFIASSASNGSVVTSTDAINWTLRTSPFAPFNITYVPDKTEKYVSSRVSVSTNGIVWTLRTTGFGGGNQIIYGNNLYVLVGSSGIISTSTDTIVWTARTSGFGSTTINTISYGDGIYVYAGNRNFSSSASTFIGVSTDTIVWTLRSAPINISGGSTYEMYCSLFANKTFLVAGGGNGNLTSTSTVMPSGFSGGSGGSGAYASWQISKDQIAGSTLSVTVGQGGTGGRFITEPTTWTLRTSGLTANIFANTYANGTYFISGVSQGLRTSTDAISWTVRTTTSFIDINYFVEPKIYIGVGGLTCSTSTDGIIWSRRTSLGGRSVSYGNGLYLSAGQDAGVRSSTDTIVWIERTSTVSLGTYYSTFYSSKDNLYFIGGDSMPLQVSTDTVVWTQRNSGNGVNFILYQNGFYIINNSNSLKVSTDTNVWTTRTAGNGSTVLYDMIYASNIYVLSGNTGIIRTSTDAIVWTARTSNTTNALQALTYGNNLFVAAGNGGTITVASNLTAATSGTASSVSWIGPNSTTYSVSVNGGSAASLPQGYPAGGSAGAAETGPDNFLQTSAGLAGRDGLVGSQQPSSLASAATATASFQTTAGGAGKWNGTGFGGAGGTINYYNNLASSIDGSQGPLISGLSYGGGGAGGGSFDIPVSFWSDRNSHPLTSWMYTITYGKGIFVAGGYGTSGTTSAIITSTNAIVWTTRTAPTSDVFYGSVYGNDLYVLVGANGGGSATVVVSSTDTINWTLRTSGAGNTTFSSVTFGNNQFVASGGAGTILSSTNSIQWTIRTSNASGNAVVSIIFANNLYLATSGSSILTSTNAIVWTVRTVGTTNILRALTFGNNTYVTAGLNGDIRTSTDTIIWTARTSGYINTIYGLNYSFVNGNHIYLIAGANAAQRISTDTIVWTSKAISTGSQLDSIVFAEDQQIYALTASNSSIKTSYGITVGNGGDGSRGGGGGGGGYLRVQQVYYERGSLWTLRTSGTSTTLRSLTYANNTYVTAGDGGGTIRTSTDAISWILRTTGFFSIFEAVDAFMYADNLYFAGTSGGVIGSIAVSSDSIIWELRTSGFGSQSIRSFTFNPGGPEKYVAGGGGTGVISTSTDSIVWILRTSSLIGPSGVSQITSLRFGNGLYVAGASNGGPLGTSTNGIEWTLRTSGLNITGDANYVISEIIYQNNSYVIIGSSGGIAASTNGIEWTLRTSGTGNSLFSLTYANNTYVTAGFGGVIRTSTDVIVWIARTSNTSNDFYALTSGNNLFVAAGASGTLITSSALDNLVSPEIEAAGNGGNGGDGYVKISWW